LLLLDSITIDSEFAKSIGESPKHVFSCVVQVLVCTLDDMEKPELYITFIEQCPQCCDDPVEVCIRFDKNNPT